MGTRPRYEIAASVPRLASHGVRTYVTLPAGDDQGGQGTVLVAQVDRAGVS